jgi:hypothetical protein
MSILTGAAGRRVFWLGLLVAALVTVALALLRPSLGSARIDAAPVNVTEPQISGSAVVGQMLAATTGEWSNDPTSFGFQWRRCPANGGFDDASNCSVITGATSGTYLLVAADVGATIRVRVRAVNADGSGTKASNATDLVVSAAAPANTALPVISGRPQVGETLTASTGTWSGSGISYAFQWKRCNQTADSCTEIAAATTAAHLVSPSELGATLRVRVTATNGFGSARVHSPPTSAISAAATGCPPGPGPVQAAQVSPPARLVIDQQQSAPTVLPVGTRQLLVRYHVSDTCGQSVQGALVYATALPYSQLAIPPEQPTGPTGFAQLSFHTLSGFPVSHHQQLIALFARARKPGDNLLTGISTRRLFSIRISR